MLILASCQDLYYFLILGKFYYFYKLFSNIGYFIHTFSCNLKRVTRNFNIKERPYGSF